MNATATSVPELNGRIYFRQQTQRLGLLKLFNAPVLRDADSLQSDLRVFFDSMASDFEELRSERSKAELGSYFDERREEFGFDPAGHLVVVSARRYSSIFSVVVDPSTTRVGDVKTLILSALGDLDLGDRFDVYLPMLDGGRSRSYSTDTNQVISFDKDGGLPTTMPLAAGELGRAGSILTKGVLLSQNALVAEKSRKGSCCIYLELKMSPWSILVDCRPPGEAAFQRLVSIDPHIKCSNLGPLLVSLFDLTGAGVDYAVYAKADDEELAKSWPRSAKDSIGSDSVVASDSRILFFEPRDPLARYPLGRGVGTLLLQPRMIALTIQVIRDEKSTSIKCISDTSLTVARVRHFITEFARSSLSADLAKFISVSSLFLIRPRTRTTIGAEMPPRGRAGALHDSDLLQDLGIEFNVRSPWLLWAAIV